MCGKEGFLTLIKLFKHVDYMQMHKVYLVKYTIHIIFNSFKNLKTYGEFEPLESETFLLNLMKIAMLPVKSVWIGNAEEKWYKLFFDIVSKDSKQKKLEIGGLQKVEKIELMAFENLVKKGVLIHFLLPELNALNNLPPCQFDCLEIFASELVRCIILQKKNIFIFSIF